jgi:hypothetical protein
MKKIALFVVLAYAALVLALTWPVLVAAFYPEVELRESFEVFTAWVYWVFLGVLLLCQAGLLFLPVKLAGGRPVKRGHVAVPIIVAGFLIGGLCFGVLCSAVEFAWKDQGFGSDWGGWAALVCCVLVWSLWSLVFLRLSRGEDARSVVLQQCRRLLQGSVIALLIAVPTHIVARVRGYCCAGFLTFVGITFGLAVLLLSFGPGVFFLYAERWRKLHPRPSVDGEGDHPRDGS